MTSFQPQITAKSTESVACSWSVRNRFERKKLLILHTWKWDCLWMVITLIRGNLSFATFSRCHNHGYMKATIHHQKWIFMQSLDHYLVARTVKAGEEILVGTRKIKFLLFLKISAFSHFASWVAQIWRGAYRQIFFCIKWLKRTGWYWQPMDMSIAFNYRFIFKCWQCAPHCLRVCSSCAKKKKLFFYMFIASMAKQGVFLWQPTQPRVYILRLWFLTLANMRGAQRWLPSHLIDTTGHMSNTSRSRDLRLLWQIKHRKFG